MRRAILVPVLLLVPATALAQQPAQGVASLEASCDGGVALACVQAATRYLHGEGVARDDARGAALAERSCDLGLAIGCGLLGALRVTGTGVPQDPARALPLVQRGCEGGFAQACGLAGRMYLNGTGVPADAAQARAYLQRACDGGYQVACDDLRAPGASASVSIYAAPPPVVTADRFAAPPPVVGPGSTYAAPPPVVVAPPATGVVRARVAAPARRVVAPPPAPPPAPTAPRDAVVFLGRGRELADLRLLYEFSFADRAGPTSYAALALGLRYASGAVEFFVDLKYGGGHATPEGARSASDWSGVLLGAGLGINLLTWPANTTWSILDLSAGVSTHYALPTTNASDARVGAYLANTLRFSCTASLRTEYTLTFVGRDAFPDTLGVSLQLGGGRQGACR